ncbi:MAG: PH domain-containing protein [Solirubrobacterales bacterium]
MAFTPSPGEQIIFQGHPSWRAILAFYLKGLAIGVVIAIIAYLFGSSPMTVFGIVLVALGIAVLIGFIKRMATTYTITNRRLNIKRGIFARDIQETRLERVQNVNYSQTVFQRALQVGDVDFDTAASDSENQFVFNGVANPQAVVTQVDKATSAGAAGTAGTHGLGEPSSNY